MRKKTHIYNETTRVKKKGCAHHFLQPVTQQRGIKTFRARDGMSAFIVIRCIDDSFRIFDHGFFFYKIAKNTLPIPSIAEKNNKNNNKPHTPAVFK